MKGSEKLRKDYKIEEFLKRALPCKVFDRIFLYEFCIVISPHEDKNFKYVIVTDEWLYLTEYPPRNITPEVHMGGITSVKCLQDSPEFLEEEFRSNCQHIVISYTRFLDSPSSWKSSKSEHKNQNNSSNLDVSMFQNTDSLLKATSLDSKSSDMKNLLKIKRVANTSCSCIKQASIPQKENFISKNTSVNEMADSTSLSNSTQKLHLFIMNAEIPIYWLIRNSWKNYQLRATMLLDTAYARQCSLCTSSVYLNKDIVSLLFDQLKEEILSSRYDEDATFRLINELRQACLRNFSVKQLFWYHGNEMFVLFLEHMERSRSVLLTFSNRGMINDELDFYLLMLSTLKIMLQETETLIARSNCLRMNSGNELCRLLELIFSEFDLKTNQQLDGEVQETVNLLEQIDDTVAFILCDLLQDIQGIPIKNGLVYTVEVRPDGEKFVDRLIKNVLRRLMHSDRNNLRKLISPLETVAIYKSFLLLQILIRGSKRFHRHVKMGYSEEFRYFVNDTILLKRIDQELPLGLAAVTLIEDVKKLVLTHQIESI